MLLSLSEYTPTHFVVRRNTGTFSLAVVRLVQGSFNLSALTPLGDLAADTNRRVVGPIDTAAPFDITGGLSVGVTIINGFAATFDIEVYGSKNG